MQSSLPLPFNSASAHASVSWFSSLVHALEHGDLDWRDIVNPNPKSSY